MTVSSRVWRKPNEALTIKNISCSVKHGGGSVMMWGAMGYYGAGNFEFIETTVNHLHYLNILKKHLTFSEVKNNCETDFWFYKEAFCL